MGEANQTRHASGDARLREEMWVSAAARGALNAGGGGGTGQAGGEGIVPQLCP